MTQRYTVLLVVLSLVPLLRAQYSSYERSIPVEPFSIEPFIRSAQLQQGEGSALLAFNANIGALGDADMLLRKVDATGTAMHELTIGDMGGLGYHDVGMEVLQHDNAYYLCGYTRSIDDAEPPTFTAFLLRTDTALNFQWQRNYILAAPYEMYANALTITAAGELLVAGTVYDGSDFHTLVMKLNNEDGSVIWAKELAMDLGERVHCLRELPGGDILLSGNVIFGFELVLPMAMKLSADGELRWGKYFNYPPAQPVEHSNFLYVHARSLDDILLCGHTDVHGVGGQDAFVVNIDSSGTVNWVRTYGTPAWEMPSAYRFDEAASELVALGSSSWFTGSFIPTALSLRIAPGGLLLDANLHGDTLGVSQNTVLTGTQRLGANAHVLTGWRGFPSDFYVTGTDNDLHGACHTHAVDLIPSATLTTTGDFTVVITDLVPLETTETFATAANDAVNVICDIPTALRDLDPGEPLQLSPNPARTEIVLTDTRILHARDRVELVDMQGKVQRTFSGNGTQRMTLPRGDLAAGAYTVRVLRAGQVAVHARIVLE